MIRWPRPRGVAAAGLADSSGMEWVLAMVTWAHSPGRSGRVPRHSRPRTSAVLREPTADLRGSGTVDRDPQAAAARARSAAGVADSSRTGGSPGGTAVYRPRDVVWLAGGHLQDGMVHWSQPEVLLYGFDLPVRGLGMSYPDFIEQDGRLRITTTDKEDARIFEIDPTLLAGLWDQQQRTSVPVEGRAFDVNDLPFHARRVPMTDK